MPDFFLTEKLFVYNRRLPVRSETGTSPSGTKAALSSSNDDEFVLTCVWGDGFRVRDAGLRVATERMREREKERARAREREKERKRGRERVGCGGGGFPENAGHSFPSRCLGLADSPTKVEKMLWIRCSSPAIVPANLGSMPRVKATLTYLEELFG